MKRTSAGFTLLEVTIALVVLGIAALGALSGMLGARQNIRDGQLRQYKATLAEARVQQLLLTDKTKITSSATLFAGRSTTCVANLDKLDFGAAPWVPDPLGAFYEVGGDGTITAGGGNGATSCTASTVDRSAFCREIAVTPCLPDGSAPSAGTAYTVWVRVMRAGDPRPASEPTLYAHVSREVFVQ